MASTDVAVEVAAALEENEEIPESADETMKLSNDPVPDLEQATVTVETENGDLQSTSETEEQALDTDNIVTGKASTRESLTFKDSVINVSYEIQPCSSKRGRDKLIDSLGFTYNCKPIKNTKTVTWTCSVRNSSLRCPATVLQRGDVFLRGTKKHQHLVGQSQPKPDTEAELRLQMKMKSKKMDLYSRMEKNSRGTFMGNKDFRIIKNGSKAGMDLLRDCLGYTYTFKRSTAGGQKTFWNCSVRNKHLHCSATIIQHGEDTFIEGPHEHKHLPAYNIPAEPHEVIPSLRKLREAREEDDDDYEEESDMEQEEEEIEGTRPDKAKKEEGEKASRSTTGQSGTTYLHSGKASAEKQKTVVAKEKRRREHETFLGPSCTINLSKCEDPGCGCGQVHCPFCDPGHFNPTKAGHVQDHLELTHFAHGVQYDDLMIVKCFKDCDVDKTFGHYHCVFCSQQIIKREFYARHMLRHLRSMGIPERLLMLPDSKYPDIINAYGYEIPICRKVTCLPSKEKHYHCPICSHVCQQRSLTVNHLWRCLQKQQGQTDDISDGDETRIYNMVDEAQLLLHVSHVKSINDLPVKTCRTEDGMYHCPLCPEDLFIPSYKQQLLVHYINHWKHRVNYKNYGLLRCYLACQGFIRTSCKVKYHYHCPICTKIIQSKGTFEDHLKSCHMLRFGENLIDSNLNLNDSLDDVAAEDPVAIQERVELLEDQLIAQSKAYYQKQVMEKKQIKKEREANVRKRPSMYRKPEIKQELVKTEEGPGGKSEESDCNDETENTVDTAGPIDEEEIFQKCTAVLSARCMQTVWSRDDLLSVLGEMAEQTETDLTLNMDGQYQVTGSVTNLQKVQALIAEAINKGEIKKEKSEKTESKIQVKPKAAENLYIGRQTMRKRTLKVPRRLCGQAVKKPCKALAKKVLTASIKKGRTKPKRLPQKLEKFPYSEIKEIIKATAIKTNAKQSQASPVSRGRGRPPKIESPRLPETPDTVKRGRGRPPKKTPTSSASRHSIESEQEHEGQTVSPPKTEQKRKKEKEFSEKKDLSLSETSTPKRYGTRGLRKDYAGMNSGIGIVNIKVEPEEVSCSLKDQSQSDVTPSRKRRKEVCDSQPMSKKIKTAVSGPGKKETLWSIGLSKKGDESAVIEDIESSAKQDGKKAGSDNKKDSIVEAENKNGKLGLDNHKDNEVGSENNDSNDGSGDNKDSKVGFDAKDSMVELGNNKRSKVGSDNEDSNVGSDDKHKKVGSVEIIDSTVASEDKDSKEESGDSRHSSGGSGDNSQRKVGSDDNRDSKAGSDDQHGEVGSGDGIQNAEESGDDSHKTVGLDKIKDSREESDETSTIASDKKDSRLGSDNNSYSKVRSTDPAEDKSPKKKVNSDQSNTFVGVKPCSINIKQIDFGGKVFVPPTSIMNKDMTGQAVPVGTQPVENKLKFQCSYCSKQFAYKSNLEDHENKHTGATPYSCEICAKAYPSQSLLMKHKTVVHAGLRPFKCSVCHKSFRFMNVLQSHMSTHTKSKSHLCTKCDKIFSTASTLKFHQDRCGKIRKPTYAMETVTDNIVIYTGQTTVTAPILEQTEIQYTVQDKQLVQENPVTTNPPQALHTEPIYEETTVETEGCSEQLDEVELYACSECNTAFDTYAKAEAHILTAHSVASE